MDRLKKQRTPQRSTMTRIINELIAELNNEVPDLEVLSAKMRVLEQVKDKVEDLDQQVLNEILDDEFAAEGDYEQENDRVMSYLEMYMKVKVRVEMALTPRVSPTPSSASYATVHTDSDHKKSYKLPKIEVMKFSGELKDWLGWWAYFERIDSDDGLHDSDKFQYLKQSVKIGTEAADIVNGFPASSKNYKLAIQALKDQYGNEELLIQVYIRELLGLIIKNVTDKGKLPLQKLSTLLRTHLRALESLDLTKADPKTFLYPLIESSLPEEVLRTWQRSSMSKQDGSVLNPPKSKLDLLLEFVEVEVKNEKQISLAKAGFGVQEEKKVKSSNPEQKKWNASQPVCAAALAAGEVKRCVFCDKTSHTSQDCYTAKKMSNQEKVNKIKEKKACFRCLKLDHISKHCNVKVKCYLCDGAHFQVMCKEDGVKALEAITVGASRMCTSPPPAIVMKARTEQEKCAFRGTMKVKIQGSSGEVRDARILIDSGSDFTYIRQGMAKDLKLKSVGEKLFRTETFGGGYEVGVRKKFVIHLEPLSGPHRGKVILEAYAEDNICGDCAPIPVGPWVKELLKMGVTLTDTYAESNEIDILVGSNFIGVIGTGKCVKPCKEIIAIETTLGWYVNGQVPRTKSLAVQTIVMSTATKDITALWDLDLLGIKDKMEKTTQEEHDEEVKQEFQNNLTRDEDGRYVVKLPWVSELFRIPNNKTVVMKRLESASNKLILKKEFENYNNVFKSWESEGIIECYESGDTVDGHYLPHRPVFKDSLTTPVRPVFDASCRVGTHPSLNQCLEKGPNLLEKIPAILLRFRQKRVGVISDIRKAFQMIGVDQVYRKYQRFLWWKDLEAKVVQEFQHCRVIFGMNCSPFILAVVLENHLKNLPEEEKFIGLELLQSLYVDNCVTSFDNTLGYEEFRAKSVDILIRAKMDLREWESNMDEDIDKQVTSVLGYKWDKKEDVIFCDVPKDWGNEDEFRVTKRKVLSLASQIFDPLGFTSPAVLQLKMLLQEAWAQDLKWDEEWGVEEITKVMKWCEELQSLRLLRVPRCAIGEGDSIQLHTFTDASQFGYSAVVFVRCQSGDKVSVQLLIAKSRVAPIAKRGKKMTIPRLELLGCVIGVRLTNTVKEAMGLQNVKTFNWTDSAIALQWILRDADWNTFVGNRLREINRSSLREDWRHIPGKNNPADLPSRGCSPMELLVSRWWEGPRWLKGPEQDWPTSEEVGDESVVREELKKSSLCLLANKCMPLFQTKYRSYAKNVRIMAYILRFLKKCHVTQFHRDQVGLEEQRSAELYVIRLLQQEYFPDVGKILPRVMKMEDGLLHVRSKLEYSDNPSDFIHPILLPNTSPIVHELIREVHRFHGHGGVQFTLGKLREKYWIPRGRRTVTSAIRGCIPCRKIDSKPLETNPIALPSKRVTPGEMFETVGVDLAGPLFLKDGKKCWIVLYTCAVYRGLVLDLVESLSSEAFINSLERFICNYGRPNTVYTDNGTNFVGANNLFRKLDWKKLEGKFATKMINWIWNPPTAAWWGGWWERLVRSTKDLLKRILGAARLSRDELTTCLSVVQSTINDRPLTTITEDGNDLVPLTPAMFMRGTKLARFPEAEVITGKELQTRYRKVKDIKVQLQTRFRKEYLAGLVQKSRDKKTPSPKVGDVVLVGADGRKRWEWPLGKIVELIPGKDGESRSAWVKTMKGLLRRPIPRLYPLEVPCGFEDEVPLGPKIDSVVRVEETSIVKEDAMSEVQIADIKTRAGRVVKIPRYFGSWNK